MQLLIEHGQVRRNGELAKARDRLVAGDMVVLVGAPQPAPLAAEAEAIPLEVVYEDEAMAIVNKPAGMSVHAGAAAPRGEDDEEGEESGRDPRSAGTLVNALLHHFAGKLSGVGGPLRPGIVHRLDKQTSGLLVVAKDDRAHQRLAEAFAERRVEKVYLALVHGDLRARVGARAASHPDEITVTLPIGRDAVRRTRMTTRRAADASGVRPAVSHVRVLERLSTEWGMFSLVEVRIETGRTHQIRVHLQALGHPVVGDTVYGAPAQLVRVGSAAARRALPAGEALRLERNFLHAGRLKLAHPRTGEAVEAHAPLPAELLAFAAAAGVCVGGAAGCWRCSGRAAAGCRREEGGEAGEREGWGAAAVVRRRSRAGREAGRIKRVIVAPARLSRWLVSFSFAVVLLAGVAGEGAEAAVQGPAAPASSGGQAVPDAPGAAPATQTPAAPAAPAQTQPSAGPALQQRPADQAPVDAATPTFRVQSNEVNLIFTVTDTHGRFVTGLHRENFGLLDDGRPPEAVIWVSAADGSAAAGGGGD